HGASMRDDIHLEASALHGVYREAHAVDCDRALARDVARELRRRLDLQARAAAQVLERGDAAHAVDVAAHEVAIDAIGEPERLLQVHLVPGGKPRGDV